MFETLRVAKRLLQRQTAQFETQIYNKLNFTMHSVEHEPMISSWPRRCAGIRPHLKFHAKVNNWPCLFSQLSQCNKFRPISTVLCFPIDPNEIRGLPSKACGNARFPPPISYSLNIYMQICMQTQRDDRQALPGVKLILQQPYRTVSNKEKAENLKQS